MTAHGGAEGAWYDPGMRTLAAIMLALAAAPAAARADACGTPETAVTVDMPSADVRVERVADVAAHTAFGAGAGATSSGGARWVINGLTKSSYRVGYQVEGLAGPGCFAPTAVRITIGVGNPVQVLITDKYAPGTCQYGAILDHEMQHVDILRRGRIIYADRFKEFVGYASRNGPFRDIGQANERIGGMVDVVRDEMVHAIAASNASIDTAESYLANQARCPAW